MAEKGARIELEPVVRQSYIETGNLTRAAEMHGVSRQTAAQWKTSTKKPGEDLDEWDKALQRKASFGLRMEALLDREVEYAEGRQPGATEGGVWDNISKIGALVVKFKAVETQGNGFDKARVFLEDLQWVAGWLKENDPEGLKVLAGSFDAMAEAFKESLNGNA
jgi:hypothetical protein